MLVSPSLLGIALAGAGCGSSKITTPGGPPPTLAPIPAEVTISARGVTPQVLHIFDGRKVTFINADTRARAIFSDTHPGHGGCGGILNVGTLAPGERREVTGLPPDACFYHEEGDPGATAFQGVMVIH